MQWHAEDGHRRGGDCGIDCRLPCVLQKKHCPHTINSCGRSQRSWDRRIWLRLYTLQNLLLKVCEPGRGDLSRANARSPVQGVPRRITVACRSVLRGRPPQRRCHPSIDRQITAASAFAGRNQHQPTASKSRKDNGMLSS